MRVLMGRDNVPRSRVTVRWLWEPRDIWVGVFWNHATVGPARFLLVYVNVIPCLPLCISWRVSV